MRTGGVHIKVDLREYDVQFGAEAAARLTHYLRSGITTFPAERLPGRLPAVFGLPTAPKATGDDRCIGTAKRIYKAYLAGLFERT